MMIELFIYFSFIMTLVFYLMRSRCQKRCGINNAEQFEDFYMSFLVNRIIQTIVFKDGKINKKFRKKNYLMQERTVLLENISLKVKLTEKDYYDIRHKLEEDENTQ